VKELDKSLRIIKACKPSPQEILVHVDGADPSVLSMLEHHHPDVLLLSSERLLGPGGSRNRLIAAASHELVANFDDDSFPDQPDYFARVLETSEKFPAAAVISAASQQFEKAMPGCHVIAVASGCGCVFRKSWFEKTSGFVPLPIAYGMEEVDISLQLHALGGRIIHDPNLHVKHDKPPPVEVSAELNATVIANMALFPYLRYPRLFWPVGIWQVLRRCLYVVSMGWSAGVLHGLQMIPHHLQVHHHHQKRVSAPMMLSWLKLRLAPYKAD
jgi:GT2 family glycosyltransferase